MIDPSHIVKGNFSRVQIDQAGHKIFAQGPVLDIVQTVRFTLSISPTDAQVGRLILIEFLKVAVNDFVQAAFAGCEQAKPQPDQKAPPAGVLLHAAGGIPFH